jgi:hypothetical protein
MSLLGWMAGILARWPRSRQTVCDHWRSQAFGRGWSQHRPRHIDAYGRRRARRTWC